MENTILIVLFVAGMLALMSGFGVDITRIGLNFIVRCLLGIVLLMVVNFALQECGQNLFVKVNEITVAISGILGIWGVIGMYAVRYICTIL